MATAKKKKLLAPLTTPVKEYGEGDEDKVPDNYVAPDEPKGELSEYDKLTPEEKELADLDDVDPYNEEELSAAQRKMNEKSLAREGEEMDYSNIKPEQKEIDIFGLSDISPTEELLGEAAGAIKETGEGLYKDVLTPVGHGLAAAGGAVAYGAEKAYDKLSNITDEYPNFWVGAAPTLMGALMGDIGTGAGIGGDALMERYKDERNAKQLAYKERQAAAAKEKGKKLQKFKYRGQDGNMYMGSYDPATGNTFDRFGEQDQTLEPSLTYEERLKAKEKSDERMGKTVSRYTDKQTGREMLFDRRTRSIRPANTDMRGLGGNQLAQVKSVQQKVTKERPSVEKYRKMGSSVRGFTSREPERQRIAFKNMAKALEGGKLSDFDMIYLQDTFSVFSNWKRRLGQQFKYGKMDDTQMKRFASEMAKAMKKDKEYALKRHSQYFNEGKAVGLNREAMEEYVGKPVGFYDKVVYKVGSTYKKVNIDNLDSVIKKGYEVVDYE